MNIMTTAKAYVFALKNSARRPGRPTDGTAGEEDSYIAYMRHNLRKKIRKPGPKAMHTVLTKLGWTEVEPGKWAQNGAK